MEFELTEKNIGIVGEERIPDDFTIDQTVEALISCYRNKSDLENPDEIDRHKIQITMNKYHLLEYTEGERIRKYFDLVKLKHDAINDERYEEADLYKRVLNETEGMLFPYKSTKEFIRFESKLMKRGKKRENIAFAIETVLFKHLNLIKKTDFFVEMEEIYEAYTTYVLPKLLAGMAASPNQINLFINKYMPD